jgi:hypothetical protein
MRCRHVVRSRIRFQEVEFLLHEGFFSLVSELSEVASVAPKLRRKGARLIEFLSDGISFSAQCAKELAVVVRLNPKAKSEHLCGLFTHLSR